MAENDLSTSQSSERLPAGISSPQLTIPIQQSKKESYYNIKRKISKMTIILGVIPYWKNILNVISLMSSVVIVVLSLFFLSSFYNFLPSKIPFIYYQASKSWSLIDKEIIIFTPVWSGIILLLLTKLNTTIFKFDRRLALLINLAIIISNFFFLIAFLQLFSLIMVY